MVPDLTRRDLLFGTIGLSLAAATGGPAEGQFPEAKRRPNIVFILHDDLGYGDLSCLNPASKIQTPHLDRLARESMTFTDAHAPAAVCTPSRYGLLTGRYCWRSRLKAGVLNGYSSPLIEEGRLTVAGMLKQQGYQTACIGKWHLGLGWMGPNGEAARGDNARNVDHSRPLRGGPTTAGFDYFYGISASLDMAPYVYIENDRLVKAPDHESEGGEFPVNWREGPTAPDFQHAEVLPNIAQHALDYIEARGKEPAAERKPFFLYLPLPSPHTPCLPSPEFRGKSQAGVYGDYVMQTDHVLGQVREALSKAGVAGNTLLVVTSDHGSVMTGRAFFKVYNHDTNYHFRGQKSDIWEGGHRVPFIAHWPGVIPAGSTCDQVICHTDLMSTVAEIVGAYPPFDAAEDSVNLLPAFKGAAKTPLREAVVHHSNDGKFAIRQGDWKLILCRGSGGWSQPEEQVPADAPAGQLYNLRDDIGEARNLYAEKPAVVAQLTALLERYQQDKRSAPFRF